MQIYYVKGKGCQHDGDIKVLKSGAIKIRKQLVIDGCYCVSNGKPMYEWYSLKSEKVSQLRQKIIDGSIRFQILAKDKWNCHIVDLEYLKKHDILLRNFADK